MKDFMFVPTQAKYLIEIEGSGFDMFRDDFDIILAKGSIVKYIPKSELVHKVVTVDQQEKHEYYVLVDTEEFGQGELLCIVRAYLRDEDYPDRKRMEVEQFVLANPKQLKVDISKYPHRP